MDSPVIFYTINMSVIRIYNFLVWIEYVSLRGGGGPENPDPPKISELDMYPPKNNNRVSPMKNENKVEVYKVRLFWAYFRPFLGQCLLISS